MVLTDVGNYTNLRQHTQLYGVRFAQNVSPARPCCLQSMLIANSISVLMTWARILPEPYIDDSLKCSLTLLTASLISHLQR